MDSFIGIYYPAQSFVGAFELAFSDQEQEDALHTVRHPEFWHLVFGRDVAEDDLLSCCRKGIVAHAIRGQDGPALDGLMNAVIGLSEQRFQWLEVTSGATEDMDVRSHPIRATTLRQAVGMFTQDPRISLAYSGKFVMRVGERRTQRVVKMPIDGHSTKSSPEPA